MTRPARLLPSAAIVLVVALLATPVASLSNARSAAGGVGAGFIGVSQVQQVGATPYWETYCPSPVASDPCTGPTGVAYIADTNELLLGEANGTFGGPPTVGPNGLTTFNATTVLPVQSLTLRCDPIAPFYPGSGPYAYVPCETNVSQAVYVVSIDPLAVVANVSIPFTPGVMAFDPASGQLFVGGWNATRSNFLAVIQTSNRTLTRVANIPGVTFGVDYPFPCSIVFDPITDRLLVPDDTRGIALIDPSDLTVTGNVSLGDGPASLAYSEPTSEILVGTMLNGGDSGWVDILNATTYSVQATIGLPTCVHYVCVGANVASVILADPVHGDAYLLTTLALVSVNLTTLTVVGTDEDYGDGIQTSAAYVPAADRIYGTYEYVDLPSPGFALVLSHTSYEAVTELLWVPTSSGILLLGAVIGVALALLSRGSALGRRHDA